MVAIKRQRGMLDLSPQELLSFVGILTGCFFVIIYQQRRIDRLEKRIDEEIRYNREYAEKKSEQFRSALLNTTEALNRVIDHMEKNGRQMSKHEVIGRINTEA